MAFTNRYNHPDGKWARRSTFRFRAKSTVIFSGVVQYTLGRTDNNTGGINYMPPNTYDLAESMPALILTSIIALACWLVPRRTDRINVGIALIAGSGLPYTETLGIDVYNSGFANARPTGVARNTLLGPGFMELDLRWSHDFYLSKKVERDRSLHLRPTHSTQSIM